MPHNFLKYLRPLISGTAIVAFTPIAYGFLPQKKEEPGNVKIIFPLKAPLSPDAAKQLLFIAAGAKGNASDRFSVIDGSKVDLNAKNSDGETALHIATRNEDREFVRALIKHGADANFKNSKGETALHIASKANNTTLVDELQSLKADVNSADAVGETALHIASREGYSILVNRLLNYFKANPNIPNNAGETPLHIAAASFTAQADIVKSLLDAGANIEAKTKDGDTPLKFAFGHGSTPNYEFKAFLGSDKKIKLLIENGALLDPEYIYAISSTIWGVERLRVADYLHAGAIADKICLGDSITDENREEISDMGTRGVDAFCIIKSRIYELSEKGTTSDHLVGEISVAVHPLAGAELHPPSPWDSGMGG